MGTPDYTLGVFYLNITSNTWTQTNSLNQVAHSQSDASVGIDDGVIYWDNYSKLGLYLFTFSDGGSNQMGVDITIGTISNPSVCINNDESLVFIIGGQNSKRTHIFNVSSFGWILGVGKYVFILNIYIYL